MTFLPAKACLANRVGGFFTETGFQRTLIRDLYSGDQKSKGIQSGDFRFFPEISVGNTNALKNSRNRL